MYRTFILTLMLVVAMMVSAQDSVSLAPKLHGTLRGKYEYQTSEGKGRFEVRTARVSVAGKVIPEVEYKAEIDLCDEGEIKMLDAYVRLELLSLSKPFRTDIRLNFEKYFYRNGGIPKPSEKDKAVVEFMTHF